MEYHCKHCDEKMIQAISATGHTPWKGSPPVPNRKSAKAAALFSELPTGHTYSETVTEPTCTAMGFTTYNCENCDHSYIGNYTDKTEHKYNSVVTPPTCTEMGYTTYTCEDCGDSYISDYTDKTEHKYNAVVTSPDLYGNGIYNILLARIAATAINLIIRRFFLIITISRRLSLLAHHRAIQFTLAPIAARNISATSRSRQSINIFPL